MPSDLPAPVFRSKVLRYVLASAEERDKSNLLTAKQHSELMERVARERRLEKDYDERYQTRLGDLPSPTFKTKKILQLNQGKGQ